MADAETSAKFRRDAARAVRFFVGAVCVVAAGIAAGGWLLLGWWGWRAEWSSPSCSWPEVSAGGMPYAMSQDGA